MVEVDKIKFILIFLPRMRFFSGAVHGRTGCPAIVNNVYISMSRI